MAWIVPMHFRVPLPPRLPNEDFDRSLPHPEATQVLGSADHGGEANGGEALVGEASRPGQASPAKAFKSLQVTCYGCRIGSQLGKVRNCKTKKAFASVYIGYMANAIYMGDISQEFAELV